MRFAPSLLSACLLAALCGLARGDDPVALDQRVVADDNSFSYAVPKSWEVKAVQSSKYKMAFAPLTPGKNFRSNFNFVVEPFNGTLDEYLKIAIAKYLDQLPGAKELDRGAFLTDGELVGKKVTADTPIQGLTLRQSFYVFQQEGQVLIMCGSSLKEEAGDFSPLIERIARTFRFEKKPAVVPPPASDDAPPSEAPPPPAARRLPASDGQVAIDLPADWMATLDKDEKGEYRIAHLVKERGQEDFSVNIIMSNDNFTGGIDEYIAALTKALPHLADGRKTPFRTADGWEGVRLVAPNKNDSGDPLVQALYIVSTPTKKYMAVCTSANKDSAPDIKRFDEIVQKGLRKVE